MANFATQKEAQLQSIERGYNKSSDAARSLYDSPMQTPDDGGQHISKQMAEANESPADADTGSFLSDKK
jgi:hypothetical protein